MRHIEQPQAAILFPWSVSGIAGVVDYWLELACQAGGPPMLADFDVAELAFRAPQARVIEILGPVDRNGTRLRYREMGGAMVEVPGRDVTEEIARRGGVGFEAVARALATSAPVCISQGESEKPNSAHSVILPFSSATPAPPIALLLVVLPVSMGERTFIGH